MKNKKGFTLIEVVIGMVIGVAVAMIAYTLVAPTQNWLFSEARRGGMGEGEAAMMRMVREIRRIKSPSSIAVHQLTQLTFVDYDNNTVDFQLSGTNLMRGNTVTSNVLARNVQTLAFTYLDANGSVTPVTADIRVITIELGIGSGTQTIRLSSGERIRNIP